MAFAHAVAARPRKAPGGTATRRDASAVHHQTQPEIIQTVVLVFGPFSIRWRRRDAAPFLRNSIPLPKAFRPAPRRVVGALPAKPTVGTHIHGAPEVLGDHVGERITSSVPRAGDRLDAHVGARPMAVAQPMALIPANSQGQHLSCFESLKLEHGLTRGGPDGEV